MAARLCIEPGCNDVGTGPRCPTHTQQRQRHVDRGRDARRGTTAQRGYGGEHQRIRARLLPLAIGTPCPRCGQVMRADQALDLDHSTPIAHGGQRGDRIVHAGPCNRAPGGRVRRV